MITLHCSGEGDDDDDDETVADMILSGQSQRRQELLHQTIVCSATVNSGGTELN